MDFDRDIGGSGASILRITARFGLDESLRQLSILRATSPRFCKDKGRYPKSPDLLGQLVLLKYLEGGLIRPQGLGPLLCRCGRFAQFKVVVLDKKSKTNKSIPSASRACRTSALNFLRAAFGGLLGVAFGCGSIPLQPQPGLARQNPSDSE